jgi:hypothetical protein
MAMGRRVGFGWATVATGWWALTLMVFGCASGTASPGGDGGMEDVSIDEDAGPDGADVHVRCEHDEDCDDDGVCTVGQCFEGTCYYAPQDELCDQGDGCMYGGCAADACVLEPRDALCHDGNDCTVNVCTAVGDQGECGSVPASDDTPCRYGLGACEGGVCQVGPAEKSVFRADTLTLIDPILHADAGFCVNANAIANNMISDAIAGFDLNFVFTFDPLAMAENPQAPIELWMADCESGTSCTAPESQDPLQSTSRFVTSGHCLQPQEGTLHFGEIEPVAAPCWVTEPARFTIDLDGIVIPLEQAQAAGTLVDADTIEDGLIFGFLSEETAAEVLLPDDLLLIGGEPLISLLPPSRCDETEARNLYEGERGWWFHLRFTASRVTDHSGF